MPAALIMMWVHASEHHPCPPENKRHGADAMMRGLRGLIKCASHFEINKIETNRVGGFALDVCVCVDVLRIIAGVFII